jgi:outer membrane protein TolC
MNKIVGFVISLTAISVSAFAQTTTLSLEDAVNLGLKNSKQLKLAGYKIDEANEKLEQSRKESLPSAKASIGYSHALMLSQDFYLPSSGGERPQMIQLPFDNTMYQGTLSLNQPLFAGNQYRYARQSAELMVQLSNLDAETDKEEVVYNIISAYINYFKLKQNQKILKQNLDDVEQKLTQIKQYEAEGLATKNDVLRFELQKSEMQLSAIELENNRHIVNYNLNLLLGLPENTEIEEQDVSYKLDVTDDIPYYLSLALKDRKEVSELKYQERLSEINIRKVKDTKLPTVGLGGNLYYINPSKKIIPETGTYLAPLIVGLNIGWDISGLYKSKNKISEARIQKKEITERSELMNDKIKSEVNKSYYEYKQSLEKINVLQNAITQATENERITESKFRNNLATTTDRIDAQTLLYRARLNLELAKSDATRAYYSLLKSTGHIQL